MIRDMYHIGYGVRDDKKSISFYQKYLNCGHVRISIEDISAGGFGKFVGDGERFRWSMLAHKVGGVDFEPVQLLSRDPRPIPEDYKWGDIGINDVCFRVEGLHGLYNQLKEEGLKVLCPPQRISIDAKWEREFFYIEDPDGINIKLEQDRKDSNKKPKVNGYEYLCLGVSNLEKSLTFYRNILGYHKLIWDLDGHLEWMDNIVGEKVYGRSLMLGSDYDECLFQLVQVADRKPQYLFKDKRWGDVGLMEFCFTVPDLEKVCDYLRTKNVKFLVEPQLTTAQLDYAYIAYVADPDGNYVEFSYHKDDIVHGEKR